MIQILFIVLSHCMISPSFAASSLDNMALIPAGKSQMGSKKSLLELKPHDLFNTDRHTLGPENPAHEVSLDAFFIDIYEVTNVKYKKYVDDTIANGVEKGFPPKRSGKKQDEANVLSNILGEIPHPNQKN
jgi:formylglycine-generating enzyme required for sulfatase activity